jgi:hypothetical protein
VSDDRGFGGWESGAPESTRAPSALGGAAATPGAASSAATPGSSRAALTAAPLQGRARPFDLSEVEELLDVEEDLDDAEHAEPAGSGFNAFLRHASLHNLLQIESLSRTTGVFLVVSGGSRGYLHLARGELVHAETGALSGEAAAAEILSWVDGEFKSCSRTLAPVRTVQSSLQALLLRLAKDEDEAAESARRHPASRVVRPPLDQEAPTETYLPPVPPLEPAQALAAGAVDAGVTRASSAPPAPQSSRPPPLPSPVELEPNSLAEVKLSASGEVISGRGAATEEFSARVAYDARLADLIGRAIRSGTPRAVELRGKRTQTTVRWQQDGTLSGSLDLLNPSKR